MDGVAQFAETLAGTRSPLAHGFAGCAYEPAAIAPAAHKGARALALFPCRGGTGQAACAVAAGAVPGAASSDGRIFKSAGIMENFP